MREGHSFEKAVMNVNDKKKRELKEAMSPEYKKEQEEKEITVFPLSGVNASTVNR